jgi:outer membrane protein assembly factor BamB
MFATGGAVTIAAGNADAAGSTDPLGISHSPPTMDAVSAMSDGNGSGQSSVASPDWPLWSGPNHDLTTLGGGVFDAGSFGLRPFWKMPLGSGYSAISVVGDRLVTGFSDGTADWLVALDTGSGRELWRYRLGETYRGHDGSDDGPVATPTIHAGVVYGLSPRGRLFALRLTDGEEVWKRDLVEESGAVAPFWGFNSSPTVIGGVLVMQTGGEDGHSISALDPATGELVWSTGDEAVYYQSPTILSFDGEEQILALTNDSIQGLRPKTGEVLWRHEHQIDEGVFLGYLQPVPMGDGRVLLTAWTESALFRIEKAGQAYRAEKTWTSRALTLRGGMAVPAPYQGHIYGFSGRFLGCIDAATGEPVWRSRTPGEGNLVLVDGHLVILAESGEVVVAAATPDGYQEEARLAVLEDGQVTRPTFASGRIFVRNFGEIAALGVTDQVAPAVAASTDVEEEEVELLGAIGELVRKVEIAENKTALIDEFMAAHREYPILEGEDLVHFVFRGDVEDLVLKGSMLEVNEELFMHRLEGTDFFFRTMKLEPGAYFAYSFAVYDEIRLDPLNPRRPDIPDQEQSVFTTRGWQEPAHLREPEGPRGRIETLAWKSEIRGNEREVQVYLPPGYDDGDERYPLLIDLRGADALEHGKMDHTLDNVIGESVAPLIVAFVPREEYSEFGSEMAKFQQALAEELMPLLDGGYRTVTRPDARGLLGGFSGGAASIYIAFKRPGIFGKAAVQSLSLGEAEDEITALIQEGGGQSLRFYVEWSSHDLKSGTEMDCRADSRRLVALLEKHGHSLIALETVQGIGWSERAPAILWAGWRQSSDRILETLFPLE